MVTRVSVMVGALLLFSGSAYAQRFEASVNGGFSGSEGISSGSRLLLGRAFNALSLDSGPSFNVTFGWSFDEQVQLEFLFGRQKSQLDAGGLAGTLAISELDIYNYMVNFVFNWRDGYKLRPYVFVGLGATTFAFGDTLGPGVPDILDRETQFSSDWGAGVRYWVSPAVGTRIGFRWTPTAVSGAPEGIWCDPFAGCWPVENQQYANQFETTVGLTVRF